MQILRYVLVVLVAISPYSSLAQGRAAAVGVQTVEQQMLSETVPVFATVTTARDGAVAGRIAGNVDSVNVLVGDRVAQGDLLVELNPELLTIRVNQSRAQIAEAQAATATARARLDRTQISFDRIEALRNTATFSQGRFDDVQADLLEARSQLEEARAREKSAEARLAETQYQLERTQIVAPFSGVILEVTTIPGAFIQAGTSVVRMLDDDAFEVQANVPARYVEALEPGAQVIAKTETGTELALQLRAVLPVEDPSTRTRAVRFTTTAPQTDALVAVGQSLTVNIPISTARNVLSVPKDALVQSAGGWTVFVAAEDKAQPRAVTLGVALGDRYEVLSGLQVGDQVVVRGNERLRPGQDIAASIVGTN
ncbi:efflux RND transporter periplasmic adaptor subunit [Yoonia sediminilitoris]|uniref:RND family efflux transporter MFP subunit n=1 Tax=Yoonia sediminilitoris TaxID=1286148 RepID=A0A2T6KR14_9RHOB|nr:efflux RND transporter periplasmic adaptor subunit [Yoonia sediminilitoris]PUB18987.1 RND family efflux transporter MFP subunit [Yoonia sediminilitoris]RCW99155.1 RND family efflux transporter MFP subunit [Yoonia sediminilitoris]